MLRAILNKSWRQHPTEHQLYGHLPSITKAIQVRRTRHCGKLLEKRGRAHKWCTPMEPPHMAEQKQDDQLEHTYSSSVRIWDVALKTCQRQWTIRRSGERGSGISVLAARYDDDDMWCYSLKSDNTGYPFHCIYIYACVCVGTNKSFKKVFLKSRKFSNANQQSKIKPKSN